MRIPQLFRTSVHSAYLVVILFNGFTISHSQAATITFTTTVTAATCIMNVPKTLNLNSKQPGGFVSPEAVAAGTVADTITITFMNCANGSFTRTPSIKVKGRTVTLGGTELYFADTPTATTPAVGYGVKLSVSGNNNFIDNANIASDSGDNGGGLLIAKSGKTVTSLNNGSLILNAQLSCGAYSPCSANSAHQVGDFKSSITFQLAYD